MQSIVRVASPPCRPLMVYDGDCHFCTFWIHRWHCATGGHVDFAASQEPGIAGRFPEIPREQFDTSVQLILPDGSVCGGAEAVFRSLAFNPRRGPWLNLYLRSPLFARLTEFTYRLVSRHRPFFSSLTRMIFGARPVPPSRDSDGSVPHMPEPIAGGPPRDSAAATRIVIENGHRSLEKFLAPLASLRGVNAEFLDLFEADGRRYSIPRFTFRGPNSSDPIRIGIFAAIHGDEPAGAIAAVEFLERLVRTPEAAGNFLLQIYPVCNPTGFEANTRHSRGGKDLNREFWKASAEPEVAILERELRTQHFSGIIQLHADDTSDGIYGYVRGHTLTENLLRPALREAGKILPRNFNATIDGFAARDGIIYDQYEGILAAPARMEPVPFEIILETPHLAALDLQVGALVIAMNTILAEYRRLISFAANL